MGGGFENDYDDDCGDGDHGNDDDNDDDDDIDDDDTPSSMETVFNLNPLFELSDEDTLFIQSCH